MSSEESGEELENDGAIRPVFTVKALPWERRELKEAKQSLDDEYRRSLSKRALYKRFKRNRDGLSNRSRPLESLSWAVRPKNKNSRKRLSLSATV